MPLQSTLPCVLTWSLPLSHACHICNNTAMHHAFDAPCQVIIVAPGIDGQSSTSLVTICPQTGTARMQTREVARRSVLRYVQRRRTLLAGIGVARGRRRVLDDVRLLLRLRESVGVVCSKHWQSATGSSQGRSRKPGITNRGSRASGRGVWKR